MRIMIADTLKALIKLKGASYTEVAAALGISRQGFNTKLYRNSFSASDLTKIADVLGCTLVFTDGNQQIIITDE